MSNSWTTQFNFFKLLLQKECDYPINHQYVVVNNFPAADPATTPGTSGSSSGSKGSGNAIGALALGGLAALALSQLGGGGLGGGLGSGYGGGYVGGISPQEQLYLRQATIH